MKTQPEKKSVTKSLIADRDVSNLQGSGVGSFQFKDNRPEAIQKRKIQDISNDYPLSSKTEIIQTMKIGTEPRFQDTFTTKTGLRGITLNGGHGRTSTNKKKIGGALNDFMHQWDSKSVANNLTRAYQSLSAHLATVNIRFQDNTGSKAANPDVSGFWIGDTIDLLNQLHKYSQPGITGFMPAKFWKNLTRMHKVLMTPDD